MIELQDISLRRGADLLLDHTSLSIGPGWRVGITGRNGTGKSSLLALLRGELQPESGEVHLPDGLRTASMAQEVPATDQPTLDYVLDGDERLRQAEAELAKAQRENDGNAIGHAHERLETLRAWSAPARAAALMAGLGFAEADADRPLSDFSGGWRMRLNIARVLFADADLLLLDEPTNHLDLDTVLWLQRTLPTLRGTVLLISHDRDFLDGVAEHIVHIEQRQLHYYRGNYSAFEIRRAEKLSQQQKLYEKQQAEAARLQGFIDRFRAKATKARQAQSRIKALEKMERVAPAHVDAGFDFRFPAPRKLPNPMLNLTDVATGYEDRTVLSGISLQIRPESRIGLLGPNGAGKTTLMKLLAGRNPVIAGEMMRDPSLVVGYFEQQQVDALPANASPLVLMREQCPHMDEQSIRDYLGSFGFRGDDVDAPVSRFSGGEKSRLGLALLIRQQPALLLMDEPANHLDLEMRDALAMALQDFAGAMVIVSHDRHLLETTVDEFLLVNDGLCRTWDGDLDDYTEWLQSRQRDAGANAPAAGNDNARDRRRAAAQRRQALKPLRDNVATLEKQLEACQETLDDLENRLGDTGLYDDNRREELTELLSRQGDCRRRQQQLEDELLTAMEKLEQAER